MSDAADVELQGVRKSFREVVAVDGISMRIERGEFFSLLGPSGCGKTTTLRMIAGFEHPTEGDVLIQGARMGSTPPFARNVNTVFQQYALFPHMTVSDNVAFGLRMKRVRRSEISRYVAEALDLVRLTGYGDRRPRELSGGQQQRVAVARALVNRPAVLLLDEPLGALDLKLRKEMQAELKRLQRTVGITFIYVTHDQEEALTMSDRIAVMSNGQVVQCGSPEAVYDRPESRFVAEFIGESNFLDGTISGVEPDSVIVDITGEAPMPVEHSSGAAAVGERVTVAIRPERVSVSDAEPVTDEDRCRIRMRGRVEELVYRGADTDILVRITESAVIRARQATGGDDGGRRLPGPGAEVTVSWAPQAARLLPP